jgi:hypothetical protein
MKYLSLTSGALGLLSLLVGAIGRFSITPPPRIELFGQAFIPSSFLILANTLLLIGIFLHLLSTEQK